MRLGQTLTYCVWHPYEKKTKHLDQASTEGRHIKIARRQLSVSQGERLLLVTVQALRRGQSCQLLCLRTELIHVWGLLDFICSGFEAGPHYRT